MKRKHLLVCAVLVLAVGSFAACGSNDSPDSSSEPKNSESAAVPGSDSEEASTAEDSANKVKYTVKVTDEAGAGLANVMVQICSESCIPGKTDENGVAEFEVEKAEYKASIISMPDGYEPTSAETNFYFEGDSTEVTIVLKAQ